MRYFYSSFFILFIAVLVGFWLGGFAGAYICALLSILEISLSFDNAVVNAKVLTDMNAIWRKRFIVWGIPVAVFGMRFAFPIIIVSAASHLGLFESLNLALNNPARYSEILEENKDGIYIFGGAFLMMVFLSFFFDNEDREPWIRVLEENALVRRLKNFPKFEILLAVILGAVLAVLIPSKTAIIAYFSAIILFILIKSFDKIFSCNGVRNGLNGFIYLEMLDASFSFDGVIGAFALSNNIFIIMLGLGAGAMFVRSLTIYLVERGTLAKFIFLEHGAHYAIGTLAAIMFIKLEFEISEVITGTLGIIFIFSAFVCSILYNRKNG
ncbi:DUF475 domain-containing protein [Campylobacter sp. VBCF_05 NA6]|uniref:DUF475 domain-containing protein n=1 Tax=unclassified Campylobacter TaxID=2593542 RepID=UPI0022E9B696|nr:MULTISPECIES: DUF475 domain-containing protein [unclassified Campylobacter]MDA3057188.1 DUF475 domain-containing protein [Campylobacter sp. VBCF_04 NA7]MDA3059240.1 DUF475 domain-containing protein [Campylobacter sp. VBCF_05 NA6]